MSLQLREPRGLRRGHQDVQQPYHPDCHRGAPGPDPLRRHQEQKSLKQQTQAARQFRSAEYEYATQAWRQGRLPYAGTTLNDNAPAGKGNEFEQYLGNNAAVPFQNQRWAQSAVRHAPGRSPLGAVPFTNNQTQTQSTQTEAPSATEATPSSREDSAVDTKPLATSPATAHATTPVATSTVAPDQE